MNEDLSKVKITLQAKAIQFLAKDGLALQIVLLKQNGGEYNSSYITTDITSAEHTRVSCQDFIKQREKWDSFAYGEQPDNEKTKGVYRTINVSDIPHKNNILKKPMILENHITKKLMDSTKWIGFRFESRQNKSVLFLKKILVITLFLMNIPGFI